jgi:oligoendopeptidase F
MTLDSLIKKRSEVAAKDCWNVEAIYPSLADWEKDFELWGRPGQQPRFPELSCSHFNLHCIEDVKKIFDLQTQIERQLDLLGTYAHLRHDEDVAAEPAKKATMLASGAAHAFREETAWIEPALLQLPQELLEEFLKSKELQEYHVSLKRIVRLKPHTLSASEEQILALAGRALSTSPRVFRALNDADLRFPACKDSQGNMHELTHGTYSVYLKSKDRELRKEAFIHLHETFGLYENTLCELMEGNVQRALFSTKVRKYSSSLEAALYPYEIDTSVYLSLIQSTREGLSSLHEYLQLRKNKLKYTDLHLYDLFVPLVEEVNIKMTYEEAVEMILESVQILGNEYVSILRKGLLEDRWVDRYENKKKRSGAYSSGCYDSMPYILMNYQGTLQDVMTLTHEAGHSMHSYLSRKHQRYQDSSYSIFVAEVASTFHEELLFQALMKKAQSRQEKAYLMNQKIDAIRSTFFRQVLFAEFELTLHEWAQKGMPLTPALVREKYLELNKIYYGEVLDLDPSAAFEWSRIPHFYSNFYVYQYATGISAATALASLVLRGDHADREKYLEFLSSGSSLDPIAVLKRAGVDMTTAQPVKALLEYFQKLQSELKVYLEEM